MRKLSEGHGLNAQPGSMPALTDKLKSLPSVRTEKSHHIEHSQERKSLPHTLYVHALNVLCYDIGHLVRSSVVILTSNPQLASESLKLLLKIRD